MKTRILLILLFFLVPLSGNPATARAGPVYSWLWGGFSTPLTGRSAAQQQNAGRAALELNGTIISPGSVFSFNELVGERDPRKGYTHAPMYTELGNLQDVPGGGICQLATTIYNAALYAGLEIVERHPHSRLITYVPPGRDATIATWRKDLKLRNTYQVPLLLKIVLEGKRLTVSLWSTEDKPFQVRLQTDSIPLEPATTVLKSGAQDGLRGQAGGKGISVITRRFMQTSSGITEQIISEDFYPPLSRIIVGERL